MKPEGGCRLKDFSLKSHMICVALESMDHEFLNLDLICAVKIFYHNMFSSNITHKVKS